MDSHSERVAPGQESPRSSSARPLGPTRRPQPGRRQAAVERWENEGGTSLANPWPTPFATSRPSSAEADALEAALRDMAGSLSNAFADGRVGTRYNSLHHRARVLRQLAAKLVLMRQRAML